MHCKAAKHVKHFLLLYLCAVDKQEAHELVVHPNRADTLDLVEQLAGAPAARFRGWWARNEEVLGMNG